MEWKWDPSVSLQFIILERRETGKGSVGESSKH